MQTTSKRAWWRRRRVVWPLSAGLFLGLVMVVAIVRSDISRVMVCNESGDPIAELTVRACGRSQTFFNVNDAESIRVKLGSPRRQSDIEVLTNGVPQWQGEFIESLGGYRVLVRLLPAGQVETISTISWWRQVWQNDLSF